MTPQPQSKEKELLVSLWHHMDHELSLDASTVSEIELEIENLPLGERAYVTAWLKGALGLHDEAVFWFKESMKAKDSALANNYLAYLGRSAHNYEHRVELFKLVDEYCTTRIRRAARNTAFTIANERLVKKFSLQLAALMDGEERDKILDERDYMINVIGDFKRATHLSSSEIEKICDEAEAIANKYGVNCSGVSYYIGSEDDNAFIVKAQTQDPHVLAKMNMELICLLTEDEYRSRPFTSWFQSAEKGGLIL